MRPFGKFSKLLIALALLVAALLFLELLTVRDTAKRLLFANSLDSCMVLLAALSSFDAARRSRGYARQLWTLLAVALALEALAQAITTYYQSFVPGSSYMPIPSDILFFVWAAPVFMMFLPASDEKSRGWDWLRILDFAQIAIVALTAYLYFFYSSSRWLADSSDLPRQILLLYLIRDAFISLGFLFRSRNSSSPGLRSFSLGMSLIFLAAFASDAVYFFSLKTALGTASWGDFVFLFPSLGVIYLAAAWPRPGQDSVSEPVSQFGDLAITHGFPLVIPLLVLFMGRSLARDQFTLAWLAISAAFLCSAVRLILTNRKQRRVSEDLLATERALAHSEHLLSSAFRSSPDGFSINVFPDGPYLDVNESFTRLTGFTREQVLGKTPLQLNIWTEPARRAEVLSRLSEGKEVRNVEFSFQTKSGQLRVGQLSASLLDLDAGRCALVVVRDITDRRHALDALRESEERFRSFVENLHVGIVSSSPFGKILYANPAALNLFGFRLEQVTGKTEIDLGFQVLLENGSILPDAQGLIPTVVASRRPIHSQVIGWRHIHSQETIWTLLDAVPQFSSSGEVTNILVSLTDLTEQRRATEALRESEERFRTLVNNLQSAVVLHGLDGRVEYANPAVLRMFGLAAESEILGKLPSELGIVTLADDGREMSTEERPVSIVLRSQSPVRDVSVGFRHPRSDQPLWVFGSSVPRFDAAGRFAGAITSFTNVTEQRRATEALRESEERFRTLVRDLHVGVILHGPDGTFEFTNQAALNMFHLTEDQVLGRNAQDLGIVPLDDQGREIPLANRPVPTVLRTGRPVRQATIGWRVPGLPDVLWIFGNAIPQFSPDGSLVRVISSFTDITDLKNAERAIHQLSTELLKLQDEERRRIGRELHDGMAQTVLAVNLSLAQLRQSAQPLNEASNRALEKARELLQQMSREIRTLSYLLHPPLLDDLGLISALKEYVNGFSERSGIDTSLELLTSFRRLPQIAETAFFRITQESLSNIQRHSGSKRARVTLREDPECVTLEITDFGTGMVVPSNGVPHRGQPRLGVGIPGMRERMAQLGGSLEIDSSAAGTTVRARILFSAPVLKDSTYGATHHSDRG